MESIIINVLIGIIAIVGFFIYWGKASGIFKEGGVIREWWKNHKAQKKENRAIKKELNKKNN